MDLKFIPGLSMKYLNEKCEGTLYQGQWSSQMDREYCAIFNNNLVTVSTRLIRHPILGKIEHAAISIHSKGQRSSNEVTNELIYHVKTQIFGEKRFAIQVYPKKDMLVDVCDVYHIFVFDKNIKNPFKNVNVEFYKSIPVENGNDITISKGTVSICNVKYDIEEIIHVYSDPKLNTWNNKYIMLNDLGYSDNVFAIETYPVTHVIYPIQNIARSISFDNDKIVKAPPLQTDVARLIVFTDPSVNMPFGIHPLEHDLTTYVNRGAYNPSMSEVAAMQKLFDEVGIE